MLRYLASLYDELEKIAATSVMKELTPAAKKFMQRMTGFSHGASIPQSSSARRLTRALTGAKAPELMTEMHGMGNLLSASERQAKQQAKQHFEGVLRQQGKVYKAAPGLEQRLSQIPGHAREVTRTPARIVEQGTVAAKPSALRRAAPAPAAAAGGTVAAGPRALRQGAAYAPTQMTPRAAYAPTQMARM